MDGRQDIAYLAVPKALSSIKANSSYAIKEDTLSWIANSFKPAAQMCKEQGALPKICIVTHTFWLTHKWWEF